MEEITDTNLPAVPGSEIGGVETATLGRPIELLFNVEMAVTVELGRTRMTMRDLLNLKPGKIVELDRPARAPVDVLVNNTLLARGEVVLVDDELGVRVTEIVGAPTENAGS